MGDNMNIGSRITNLRKKKQETQESLAKKLFVSEKTIASWESNRTEPSLEMLVKLSEILDCSVAYFVYGDNTKSDIETEIRIKLSEKQLSFINFLILFLIYDKIFN